MLFSLRERRTIFHILETDSRSKHDHYPCQTLRTEFGTNRGAPRALTAHAIGRRQRPSERRYAVYSDTQAKEGWGWSEKLVMHDVLSEMPSW